MEKLNIISVVVKKEVKEISSSRRSLIVSAVFAGWFGFMFSSNMVQAGISLDLGLYVLGLTLAAFISFVLSAQIFLREKFNNTIIDLLCTPLDLREILMGKVLGVFIFAYGFSLLSVVLMLFARYQQSGYFSFPSLPLIFHIFINVPLFIIFAISLNGLIQLMLGIKENRIAYFITYFIVFLAMFLVTRFIDKSFKISWPIISVSFSAICLLIVITFVIAKKVSKERIITTID